MKKKQIKIVCIILAALIAFSAAVGIVISLYKNFGGSSEGFSTANTALNEVNSVDFRKSVNIADDPKNIQKNFKSLEYDNSEYTISYKNSIPDYFIDIKVGEVFCVYPDSNAKESFFALGFCGKLTAVNTEGCSVSFIIPEITEVFSDVHIDTKNSENNSLVSTAFYPSENVSDYQLTEVRNSAQSPIKTPSAALTAAVPKSASLGIKESSGFKFKEPKSASLLDDYTAVCDKMELKFKCNFTGSKGFSLGGSGKITLEETAVKMLLDYHYNDKTDTAEIKDYSLGLITKQKVDLSLSAKESVDLDDLKSDSSSGHIIDIEDVTESEDGKVVLGTYLVGLEASLPKLKNNTNKVNYLSVGIAIQFVISASGELGLKYSIEESGFAFLEANGNGKNKHIIKGYDYPNPTTDSREPTEEEASSLPSVTSKLKGEASLDMAVGGDIGICILGMIPIKQANNFLELEIKKSFTTNFQEEKTVEVTKNNNLLDDNVSYLSVLTSSYMKMNFGAKIDFGVLKYTVARMGGSIQLYKKAWIQFPPPKGFSHSQCGFGGVFVGQVYSDEELEDAFKTYMKDNNQYGIITSAKDSLFGSVVNSAFNNFNFIPIDISDYLDGDLENYQMTYFTSGVIYLRDASEKVVAAFVTGEDVPNAAGLHNGLGESKIVETYSYPDLSSHVELDIGTLARHLLNIDWLEDTDLTESCYFSCDGTEKMNLVICNDELKMIIVTAE